MLLYTWLGLQRPGFRVIIFCPSDFPINLWVWQFHNAPQNGPECFSDYRNSLKAIWYIRLGLKGKVLATINIKGNFNI